MALEKESEMRVRTTKAGLFLHLAVIMLIMPVVTASAADAISLPASEPYTMYYTTNGATPSAPTTQTITAPAAVASRAMLPANTYIVQGTSVTPPPEPLPGDVISIIQNAGRKGKHYVKSQKLKIHESRYEFERHVKEKHGKKIRVMDFESTQTENGLKGYIFLVENKDPAILQLGDKCTDIERANRVAVAKDFISENHELIGLTQNEELYERGLKDNCLNLYFDGYINGYQVAGSVYRVSFVPQWNYSFSTHLQPITPEMYAAAQADALSPEEIAQIVYKDLGIAIKGKTNDQLPKLEMRKYLRSSEPYVYWKVAYRNVYEINAITGEIFHKRPNVVY